MLDRVALAKTMEDLPEDQARLLRTYVGEADFFARLLSSDLATLNAQDHVLEVGSGVGLLAMEIATRGHSVVAFEPQSSGFGRMREMRETLMGIWTPPIESIKWVDDFLVARDRRLSCPPAYAIAINVVEHVPDVGDFIADVMSVMSPGGRFRFICPNYHFPYEPHFDILTAFSKAATFRLFRKAILNSSIDDADGLWNELSWPTVRSVRRTLSKLGYRYAFSSRATAAYLSRVLTDESFIARKGPLMSQGFRLSAKTLPPVVKGLPVSALPVIDCTVWA